MEKLRWSKKETTFLKEQYKKLSYGEIGVILGKRSVAVRVKAHRLGLEKLSSPGQFKKGNMLMPRKSM